MQPTMKLRWKRADRTYKTDPAIEDGYGNKLVLQQWWETEWPHDHELYKGEWRDIPIEEET